MVRNITSKEWVDGELVDTGEDVMVNGIVPGSGNGGGGGAEVTRTVAVGETRLADGNAVALARINSSSHPSTAMEILSVGMSDSVYSAPAGLTVRIYDATNAVLLQSYTSVYSSGSPLHIIDVSSKDILIELQNATGGSLDASASVELRYA